MSHFGNFGNDSEKSNASDNSVKSAEELKRLDDLRSVKIGQIIIFVLAGLMILSSVIEYNNLGQGITVFYIYGPIVGVFALLGFLYYKDPVAVPVIALILYCALQILSASEDPSLLGKGIVFKFIIIAGLVRACIYGKSYKAAKKFMETDPLDQNVFDEND